MPSGEKPVGGADAGTVQHLGRSDRAGAENDLAFGAGLDELVARMKRTPTARPFSIDEAVDQHVLFQP